MKPTNNHLKKVNDVAQRNSQMPKGIIRDVKDGKLQADAVNPTNDFEMVAKDLRPPLLRKIVKEKLTEAERKELKKVKKLHKQAA
jgi:hypothetical protein